MAQSASGVTVDGLKGKLMEQLQAQHVEIEDMSGMESGHNDRHSVPFHTWKDRDKMLTKL